MGSVYKVDQSLADQLVHAALDAGINFFNTADAFFLDRRPSSHVAAATLPIFYFARADCRVSSAS